MPTKIEELGVDSDFDFPELDRKWAEYRSKSDKLGQIFDEAKDDGGRLDLSTVTVIDGDSAEKAREIDKRNKELSELKDEVDSLAKVAKAAGRVNGDAKAGRPDPGGSGSEQGAPAKEQSGSLGEMFVKSRAYEDRHRKASATLDVDLKTLFSTTAGWAPESTRSGRVVLDAQRPVQVTDILPTINTTQNAYVYMEETTFTNAAAETAEGVAKPEAALALTEQSVSVRKVPVWIPVTDEQLEDVVGIQDYLEGRLEFMLRQKLDGDILTGSGVAPNLTGINNKTGVLTQAKGTDPTPDAVYKAAKNVRVTGRALPNAVIFHPNDWQDVRLLRTSDGVYIWGNPSEAGPMRIWGLGVVESDAQTEGTAVVGDFANFSLLVLRQDVTLAVSDSHSTFFVENKQAVRAELRAAAVWLRPTAFSLITGV